MLDISFTGSSFQVVDLGISGAVDSSGRATITVNTGGSTTIFQRRFIDYNPFLNRLGMYSFLDIGRDLEARMIGLKPMGGLLASRPNCKWSPKGSINRIGLKVPTCALSVQMEQCPDVFYNCFERIFDSGNGVVDFESSEEGIAALEMIIKTVVSGIGRSIVEYMYYSNDSRVTAASFDKNTYDELTSTSCEGFMPKLISNKTYTIPSNDIGIDGRFSGDAETLFDALIENASEDLRDAVYSGQGVAGETPMIAVSHDIFTAYANFMRSSGTEAGFTAFLRGEANSFTPITIPNAYVYMGIPVVYNPAFNMFDSKFGSTTNCAALIAPGALGVAISSDTAANANYGLTIERAPGLSNMGKIEMASYMRLGVDIDEEAISFAYAQ